MTFGFPPRRYELLSRLALAALAAGGERGVVVGVCREAGAAEGQRALATYGRPPRDRAAAAALVASITEEQGLLPKVAWRDGALSVVVNNCSFRELSGADPELVCAADPELVCAMHRAYLEGILEVVTAGLGRLTVDSDDCRISCGDAHCELVCSFAAAEA